jgi:hypothetical protein
MKNEEDTKLVPLKDAIPDTKVIIWASLSNKEERELLKVLNKNNDVLACLAFDLHGVSKAIIEHSLDIIARSKAKKAKVTEDVKRPDTGSEGRGVETVGCKGHPRSEVH